jgi:dihydrofolate reductase
MWPTVRTSTRRGSCHRSPVLTARLIDELHLVIARALLARGENLFVGIDTVSLGYQCTQHASSEHATHMVLTK